MKDGLKYFPHWTINVIANTFEKYLNVSINFKVNGRTRNLTILDSLQFLNSSLAKLIDLCPKQEHTSKIFISDDLKNGKGSNLVFYTIIVYDNIKVYFHMNT